MKPKRIRVIAICAIRSGKGILVFEGFDSVKDTFFYRPLGGGVEPGETSEEAVTREILEEVGLELRAVRLLGVLENLFHLEGDPHHEIVFVYEGHFRDELANQRDEFIVKEDNGYTSRATWRDLSSFDDRHRLVPEELLGILQRSI
ncbi:MAG TPA: NUDIX domain-containing protein [bacterium]